MANEHDPLLWRADEAIAKIDAFLASEGHRKLGLSSDLLLHLREELDDEMGRHQQRVEQLLDEMKARLLQAGIDPNAAVPEVDHMLRWWRQEHRQPAALSILTQDAGYWVATVATSGIIGNLAHAAVVKLWKRARGFRLDRLAARQVQAAEIDPRQLLDVAARLAVRDQCARHGIPVPRLDDLLVEEERWDANGCWVGIRSRADDSFAARVQVPYKGIATGGMKVTIRRSRGSNE